MQTKKQFFRKVATPAVFGALLLLLTACPRSKTTYVDLGRIPEHYLATVPYRNGDVFRMKHESDRTVIDFTVSRHRQKEAGYDWFIEKYKPAPNYVYEYEADITKCTPNYPIFNWTDKIWCTEGVVYYYRKSMFVSDCCNCVEVWNI